MMTNFEDQLREQLQARAEQITPNPQTWDRVQAGIRREQRFRWVYAGAAASALATIAAVAVLVVPGFLNGSRVQLEEGPGVAGEPEDPAPRDVEPGPSPDGASVALADMVIATADGLKVHAPGGLGTIATPEGVPVEGVAVRPGSSVDDLDLVYVVDCTLGRARRDPGTEAGGELATAGSGGCLAGPRFSPDGEDLAWIEQGPDGVGLVIVGWSDEGEVRARNARFGLDLSELTSDVGEVRQVRIMDWTYFGETGDTEGGELLLAITDADGVNHVAGQRLERQGDGAIAIPPGERPTLFETDELRNLGLQREAGGTWSLAVTADGEVVVARDDMGRRPLFLADDIAMRLMAPDAPVWFDVVGPTAVFGDGERAWAVRWTVQGWTGVAEVLPDAVVRNGAILNAPDLPMPDLPMPDQPLPDQPAPTSGPAASTEEDAAAEPTEVPVEDGAVVEENHSGLTDEALATRDALLAAVEAEDLEAMAALADPEEFSFSLGAGDDPVAFWQAEIANGIDLFGQLRAILQLPFAETPSEGGPDIVTWPYAFDVPYETLASAQLIQLEEAVGGDVMTTYAETNQYLGYRVGIRENGALIYLIAGD